MFDVEDTPRNHRVRVFSQGLSRKDLRLSRAEFGFQSLEKMTPTPARKQ